MLPFREENNSNNIFRKCFFFFPPYRFIAILYFWTVTKYRENLLSQSFRTTINTFSYSTDLVWISIEILS